MNNEPVAWISEYTIRNCLKGNLTNEVRATTKKTTNCTIPLYTHPAKTPTLVLDGNRVYATEKTLTDEEIKQVWKLNLVAMGNDLDFARAILRKASEK